MKVKSFLVWSTGIVLAATAIFVGQDYRRWKRRVVERIQTESHLLETPQGSLEYGIEGYGPAVLLIHGSPGGYDQGMALAHFLDLNSYKALAPSRPGYRRTPLASGKTPEMQADLFAVILDRLNIPHVIVIGLSGGGPSALQFALRHPERCQGLVLLSALSQKYTEEGMYRALSIGNRELKRVLDRLLTYDFFLYLLLKLLRLSPETARASEFVISTVTNNQQTDGYRNDMRQFAHLPTYPVQDIVAPILIVHGTADVDVAFQQAEQLAKRLPRAQFVAIEGADHITTLASEECTTAIRTFLRTSAGVTQ